MTNKVKYGLSDVHYSLYTEGTSGATWATPVSWPGAVSLTLEYQGDSNDFFADNGVFFNETKNNGLSGELEMAYIDDSIKKALLGYKTVTTGESPSTVTDLVDITDATFAPFALLFKIDGNVENKGYVYYMCKLGRPNISASTTTESIEPDTVTCPITITPVKTALGEKLNGREHTLTSGDTWFSTAPSIPTLDA